MKNRVKDKSENDSTKDFIRFFSTRNFINYYKGKSHTDNQLVTHRIM